MEGKDRVLILGATGYIGRRLVKASIALGHPTFVLFRPENVSNRENCQMFMEFKMEGAHLLQASLEDRESLVSALKQVDVVVSAVRVIVEQLQLIEAIKEVGTIKRFLPSEFGMDVDRMEHAISPGDRTFVEKRVIRRAIEKANIPHTYVSANCFAGIFLAGLAQLATFMPKRDRVNIHGHGDKKCTWVAEEDVAMYAILAIDDPRTLNKVLYVRPPANILTQMEVVKIWERIIGKELQKTFLSAEEWLSTMDRVPLYEQIAVAHMYQIFYLGDLDFKVEGPRGVDSSKLYPDHKYVTVEEYLRRFA
ncbi:bifunctional pinoresinol-lariciresinol reductase 2 isoform X2 [Elaeis guineensis]|uniref:Bifunctional pinoresinol-lariciresinol reductase 2 isoform X2 n=1 Tax=Elaeis guineensis var. tenera TaxID=51953 RepID=A0A6I9QTW1_ELAGV|nr:bifunctional pinoresinol-lariciresinol reductase 2 isoform X2 [Elaeis guineensis]